MKKLFISFIALSMAIGSFPLQSVRAAGSKLAISEKQVSCYGASSNPVSNIVDGKKDTYWNSMSQNGEGNSDAEKKKSRMYDHNRYIDIELNGTYDLDEIIIYNKEGSYNNYYIYASLDGEKYDKIVSKTNNSIATKEGDKHSLKGVKASYLRLNMAYNSDSYETNLAEIEVFGKKLSDDVKPKPEIKVSDCYFSLDGKVTKRSRLNRPAYSGQRFRCRLRNSLRSDSAGSGRFTFTLRLTPVRLGLS